MKNTVIIITLGLCLTTLIGCSSSSRPVSKSPEVQSEKQTTTQQAQLPTNGSKGNSQGQGLFNDQRLLSLLKIDSQTLQNQIKGVKSLADVAKEQGVQEQLVIDLITKESEQMIADAVKAGQLTQKEADQMMVNAPKDHIKKLVERKGMGENGKLQHYQ